MSGPDFTKLLEMATRTDERTKAISEDVAEIKELIGVSRKDIDSLKHSRSKARGILLTLSGVVGFVGGERFIEWLNLGR